MKLLLLLASVTIIAQSTRRPLTVKIGSIFQSKIDEHLDNAFRFSVNEINDNYIDELFIEHKTVYLSSINHDSLLRQVCDMAEQGVIAIFGPPNSKISGFIEEICDQLEIPYFKLLLERSKPGSQAISLYPDMDTFIAVLEDLITYFEWDELLILYIEDSSIVRLQGLLGSYLLSKVFMSTVRIENNDFLAAMTMIRNSGRTKILIDIPNKHMNSVLLAALQVGLVNHNYHFLLTSMDMHNIDLTLVRYNSLRITGLHIVDSAAENHQPYVQQLRHHWTNQHYFPITELAVIRDAMTVFAQGILNASKAIPGQIQTSSASCGKNYLQVSPLKEGSTLHNYFEYVVEKGLTGKIQFRDEKRVDVKLDILHLNNHGSLEKIGSWDGSHRYIHTGNVTFANVAVGEILRLNTTLVMKPFLRVTTIAEKPYVMVKRDAYKFKGNERYEGFCIDLLKRLAEELDFNYEVHIVKDEKYGSMGEDGQWDGMIGELIRNEAEIAVAPLTVNYRRSQVVDFTKPFLSLGISILFRVPLEQSPSLFSFMYPLSNDIWFYIMIAAMSVTFCMFATARISPFEWVLSRHRCNLSPGSINLLKNWYTFPNTVWYTVSTLLKGGCDFGPKAISTRLLGGVWWVFTLVITSAYTANLAAVLTVERIWIPIRSMEDLANQTSIAYGAIEGGSTMQFFSESMIGTHVRMWNYMNQSGKQVLVRSNQEGVNRVLKENYAYLMESISLEFEVQQNCNLTQVGGVLGSKGYGIATRKGSAWTEKLSSAILNFGERGIISLLKTKWWKNRGANCQQQAASMKQRVALTMDNVAGVFVFLLVGLFVAVAIALIEFCIKSRENAEIDQTYLIQSRSSDSLLNMQSLCSEMAQELCFAVRLHRARQRHKFSRRCSTCAEISAGNRATTLPSNNAYVPSPAMEALNLNNNDGSSLNGQIVALVDFSNANLLCDAALKRQQDEATKPMSESVDNTPQKHQLLQNDERNLVKRRSAF